MPRLTFVTPWYGPDVPGGAESLTRQTIHQLHKAGFEVEVVTTCLKDLYGNWDRNYHRPGTTTINHIPVHRFPIEPRNRRAFNALNARLMQGQPIAPAEEQTFIDEMFHAPTLYDNIAQFAAERLYFFIPYMFSTTYYGAQICPGRSFLIPCLHDEPYAHLNLFHHLIPQVRGLIFNTYAEQAFANRTYACPPDQRQTVIGMGIDPHITFDADRFRQKYNIHQPFIIYAGRREAGKNIPLLLDYWRRYIADSSSASQLVLIGPNDLRWSLPPNTHDLGFVPLQDKYDAYSAATALCQPSLHESFSIVQLESWLAGTPSLVHGHCAVTRDHCRRSNGGLYFYTYADFSAALDYLFTHPTQAQQMAVQGRHYVEDNFKWELIVAKYRTLIQNATP